MVHFLSTQRGQVRILKLMADPLGRAARNVLGKGKMHVRGFRRKDNGLCADLDTFRTSRAGKRIGADN